MKTLGEIVPRVLEKLKDKVREQDTERTVAEKHPVALKLEVQP